MKKIFLTSILSIFLFSFLNIGSILAQEIQSNACTSITAGLVYDSCCSRTSPASSPAYNTHKSQCDAYEAQVKQQQEKERQDNCVSIVSGNYSRCCGGLNSVEYKSGYSGQCHAYRAQGLEAGKCLTTDDAVNNWAGCCGTPDLYTKNSQICSGVARTCPTVNKDNYSQCCELPGNGINYYACKKYAPSVYSGTDSSGSGSSVPAAKTGFTVKLKNPLKVDSVQDVIKAFMSAIVRVSVPFIVVFFIYSGFLFVTARGNPTALETAKNTFKYTIIGTLLILGAWTITNAIVGTINSIGS